MLFNETQIRSHFGPAADAFIDTLKSKAINVPAHQLSLMFPEGQIPIGTDGVAGLMSISQEMVIHRAKQGNFLAPAVITTNSRVLKFDLRKVLEIIYQRTVDYPDNPFEVTGTN